MNTSTYAPTWLIAVLGVCTFSSVRADSQTEVAVVSNLTFAGEKIDRPSSGHPVYYLPVISGFMEPVNPVAFGEKPPPFEEVEHQLEAALSRQGYFASRPGLRINAKLEVAYSDGAVVVVPPDPPRDRKIMLNQPGDVPLTVAMIESPDGPYSFHLAHKTGPHHTLSPLIQVLRTIDFVHGPVLQAMPAIVLVIQWGELHAGIASRPTPLLDLPVWVNLLAGDHFGGLTSWEKDDIVQRTSADRYFVVVTAYDFKSCLGPHRVRLWRTRMSLPSNGFGVKYADMLPLMIKAGESQFGRETNHTLYTDVPRPNQGRVEIGQPVVKDYEEVPQPLPDTGSDRFLPLKFKDR